MTNTSGIATFSYAGTNPGTDTVTALVRSTATANVNGTPPVSMVWTLTPQSPPVTQGWIGAPLNGASVTGTVPITVGAGLTLTDVKVEYWPATNPAGSDDARRKRARWSRSHTCNDRHDDARKRQLRHSCHGYRSKRKRTGQPGDDHRHRGEQAGTSYSVSHGSDRAADRPSDHYRTAVRQSRAKPDLATLVMAGRWKLPDHVLKSVPTTTSPSPNPEPAGA